MSPEIPLEEKKRKKVMCSYMIYKDQTEYLGSTDVNQSKLLRRLIDEYINELGSSVIQELENQHANQIRELKKRIETLNNIIKINDGNSDDRIGELMQTIESQKSVIVALGRKGDEE